MINNKLYKARIPMKQYDKEITKTILAPNRIKAKEETKEELNPEYCNLDKLTISKHPKYQKIKAVFNNYNILGVVSKEPEKVKLKVENNRRKNNYDIFIIFFTGPNGNKIKSILRVKDLSQKYGYLSNGQPNTNMEYYKP